MTCEADIRVKVGCVDHWKVEELEQRAGAGAFRMLVRLWAWARVNRPDGSLSGLPDRAIEHQAGWRGQPGLFVETLRELPLLDADGTLHDWEEHQAWAVGAPVRSEHARRAARARHGTCPEIAPSMLRANSEHAPSVLPVCPSPSPDPSPLLSSGSGSSSGVETTPSSDSSPDGAAADLAATTAAPSGDPVDQAVEAGEKVVHANSGSGGRIGDQVDQVDDDVDERAAQAEQDAAEAPQVEPGGCELEEPDDLPRRHVPGTRKPTPAYGLIQEWNAVADPLGPTAARGSDQNLAKASAALRRSGFCGEWRELIAGLKAHGWPWKLGQPGGHEKWRPDLKWILKPENMASVLDRLAAVVKAKGALSDSPAVKTAAQQLRELQAKIAARKADEAKAETGGAA